MRTGPIGANEDGRKVATVMSVRLVGRVPVPADVGEHRVRGRIAGAVVVVRMDVYAVERLQALGDTGEGHVDSRRGSVPAERNGAHLVPVNVLERRRCRPRVRRCGGVRGRRGDKGEGHSHAAVASR